VETAIEAEEVPDEYVTETSPVFTGNFLPCLTSRREAFLTGRITSVKISTQHQIIFNLTSP
jgi:hypothetical protein